MKQNTQGLGGPVPPCWTTVSFRISTVDGWLNVGLPFGIDQRSIDQAGNTGWIVTHLPSGLAVVAQDRGLAVALVLVGRIASLIDWDAQTISATPDVRERVRKALN